MYLVYVTASDKAMAEKLASTLVSEKLAACANIFATHTAIYEWEGQIQSGEEVAMTLKTSKEAFPKLKERLIALHDYDTPCILAMPIEDGAEAFLDWVESHTSHS